MKKRLFLLTILGLSLILIPFIAKAEIIDSGTCGESLIWTLDNKGLLLIKGEGEMTSHPWEERKDSIQRVIIDYGITKICNYAFFNCNNLSSITTPESVNSIGARAFSQTNLTSFTIPEGVSVIHECVFSGCSNLLNIIIPSSVITIEREAFSGCSSLESITIPNGVKSIEYKTFSGCSSLKSVHLPYGLISINYGAFYNCSSLINISIPETVTGIGDYAFYKCSSLESITIPSGVQNINNWCFYNCQNLKNITIPEGVVRIFKYAFYECYNISNIKLPNTLESIGNYAFLMCYPENVVIPPNVSNIGEMAFSRPGRISFLQDKDKIVSINDSAFGTNFQPTVYCYKSSSAESYANSKGWDIVLLDSTDFDSSTTISLEEDFEICCGKTGKRV